jgi:uncharacterized protein YpuA (DUF1002 family)
MDREEYHKVWRQWCRALSEGVGNPTEIKLREILVEADKDDKQLLTLMRQLGIEVDDSEFRRLNAKRMKAYRDRKRARKYSPRPSRLFSSSKISKPSPAAGNRKNIATLP